MGNKYLNLGDTGDIKRRDEEFSIEFSKISD